LVLPRRVDKISAPAPRAPENDLTRNQRLAEERSRLQDYIARFRSGTRARQAQSRIKRLAKLDPVTSVKPMNREGPRLMHNSQAKMGSRPLAIFQNLVVTRGSRAWHPLSLNLPQGAKVALVGANGTGKTSLLNTIYACPSQIAWVDTVEIAYLRQESVSELPDGVTGIMYLHELGFDREEIHCWASFWIGSRTFRFIAQRVVRRRAHAP